MLQRELSLTSVVGVVVAVTVIVADAARQAAWAFVAIYLVGRV